MIRAAIFDIDGTLIDSVDAHAEAWAGALRRFHIDVPVETMRREIGKGADHILPGLLPGDKLAPERERIEALRADLFKAEHLGKVRAFPGVPDLFRRLRAEGLTIALASSGKADEVEDYVKIAGIDGLFDAQTTSDDSERSKPDPDIFAAALAKIAPASAEDAIVIGDSIWDVIAGSRAGIASIGLACGAYSEAELREAGAVATYRDPADLLTRYADSPLAR